MSQENVEVAVQFLEALGRGDYDDAIDCLHGDAVWTNTSAFPGARTITGSTAIIDFWKTLVESFDQDDGGLEIESVMASGQQVVTGVHSRGRGIGGGVPVDVHWALSFSLRDDRIERLDISGDYMSALEAAGLSE